MNINGNEFSWSSVALRLLGVKTTGFKAIKYSDEIEGREPVYKASVISTARTRGRYKVGDCSLTMHLSDFKALIARVGSGWGEVEGEIVVQFREGSDYHEHVLERVRLGGAVQRRRWCPRQAGLMAMGSLRLQPLRRGLARRA